MTKAKQNQQSEASVEEILEKGNKQEVRALFSFDDTDTIEDIYIKFNLWSRWFFPKYFDTDDAPFHEEMDRRRIRIYLGLDPTFLNAAFRGSAKTTKAKLFRAFVIANDELRRRKYFRILSKDLGNAKQSVTDVYNILVSEEIKFYYPEVFEKTEAKREETMGSFTTTTGIKMIAVSIGTDQRGALQEDIRPDFDWYDDFETRLSLTSATVTFKIWENMEEARTGLSKDGVSEYTCNYLSERGNVHKLVEKVDKAHQMITPIEIDGVPTWDRYSVEDLKRIKLETDDYEGEYLCEPSASKDVYFDTEKLETQTPKTPIDVISDLKIFKKFIETNRICGGHDIGGGVGLDHSTSVYLDLDQMPVQVIATRKTNVIKPDAYAHIIAKDGKRFGECYQAVEKNYGSTVDILKTAYDNEQIHRTYDPKAKVVMQIPKSFGWDTNAATKPMMLAGLSKAIENGLIEINDPDIIAELRSYTTGDLMDNAPDVRLTTRHFDLLTALAIAWAVRSYVSAPRDIKDLDPWMRKAQRARQNKVKINPAA